MLGSENYEVEGILRDVRIMSFEKTLINIDQGNASYHN